MPDISIRKMYYGESIKEVQMFRTFSMHMGIELRKKRRENIL
jgi:hypothetical protein